FVHVNPSEGTGFIGVVRELQLMSFDEVYEIPHKARHLGVPLHQLPCCIDDRSSQITLLMPLIAWASQTGLAARGTGLGFLGEYSLSLVVIGHRHGVAALIFHSDIDEICQIGSMI